MAIILRGSTICRICGKVIKARDEIVGFPAFVEEEDDPLYFFHDAGFHKECFDKHPLKQKVIDKMAEIEAQPHPSQMICHITGKKMTMENIGDPDNHVSVGNLTNDSKHPLYKYNDIELNKMYLSDWKELPDFINLLEVFLKELEEKEEYKGKQKRIKSIIARLNTPARKPIKPEIMERLKERRRREGKE